MVISLLLSFLDLASNAEGWDLFQQSLDSPIAHVAFVASSPSAKPVQQPNSRGPTSHGGFGKQGVRVVGVQTKKHQPHC
ncbi:hypothetical protein ACS0TY_004483 [Phlomoides rotata]